ncbi:hypothetical protein GEV33_001244 [Tenebrio molitor]|uniref:Uncharacterized protein n=1 Tax=Tenebrio molitor TaxID=7067 RepID=A0A8J6HWG7_TENMO|nr:hypothetical protein GEV33_001244 [Tenebrio molitor]
MNERPKRKTRGGLTPKPRLSAKTVCRRGQFRYPFYAPESAYSRDEWKIKERRGRLLCKCSSTGAANKKYNRTLGQVRGNLSTFPILYELVNPAGLETTSISAVTFQHLSPPAPRASFQFLADSHIISAIYDPRCSALMSLPVERPDSRPSTRRGAARRPPQASSLHRYNSCHNRTLVHVKSRIAKGVLRGGGHLAPETVARNRA